MTAPCCGRTIRSPASPCRCGRRARSCAAPPPTASAATCAQRRMEEHNRLLYVALTRAEDRLVVCGWRTRRPPPDDVLVQPGQPRLRRAGSRNASVRRLGRVAPLRQRRSAPNPRVRGGRRQPNHCRRRRPGSVRRPTGGRRRRRRSPPGRCRWRPAGRRGWNLARSPPRPRRWPSGRGRAIGSGAGSCCMRCCSTCRRCRRRSARMRPGAGWTGPATGLPPEAPAEMAAEVHGDPGASRTGAAVRTGQPSRGAADRRWWATTVIGGLVDRLAVLPDRVLIADFKTNRRPPARVADTPVTVSAPDGRLSRRAARHLSGSPGALRADLDPRGAGEHAGRRAARFARPRPCAGAAVDRFPPPPHLPGKP